MAVNSIRLADPDAERVRQSHARAIADLQSGPAASTRVILDVIVPNNGAVLVPHGLGRIPRIVLVSPVRGAATVGVIGELRGTHPSGAAIDRRQSVCITAAGFGADVTVDVEVK